MAAGRDRGLREPARRDRVGVEDEEEQSFDILDRRASDVLGLGQSWSLEAAHGTP